MKAIKHVSNTWLVALHLFPVLGLGFNVLQGGNIDAGLLPVLYFFGAFFSLPALLLCLLVFTPLLHTSLSMQTKLIVWMLLVCMCILAGAAVISLLFFNLPLLAELWVFIAAALAATLVSIVLRLPQFFNLYTTQTNTYEQNLV